MDSSLRHLGLKNAHYDEVPARVRAHSLRRSSRRAAAYAAEGRRPHASDPPCAPSKNMEAAEKSLLSFTARSSPRSRKSLFRMERDGVLIDAAQLER